MYILETGRAARRFPLPFFFVIRFSISRNFSRVLWAAAVYSVAALRFRFILLLPLGDSSYLYIFFFLFVFRSSPKALHNQPIRFGPPDNSTHTHTHTHTRGKGGEEEEETHQHHGQRRGVQEGRCSPLHLSVKSKRESKKFWRRHIIPSRLSFSLLTRE